MEVEFKFKMVWHIKFKNKGEAIYADVEKGVQMFVETFKGETNRQWGINETKQVFSDYQTFVKSYLESPQYLRSKINFHGE